MTALTKLERAAINLAICDSTDKPMIQIQDVNGEYCRAYSELLVEAERVLQRVLDEEQLCAHDKRSTQSCSSSGSSGSPSRGAEKGSNPKPPSFLGVPIVTVKELKP